MPKAKQAQPPPDDPAQSERFMRDAAKLAGDGGGALFERAMQSIARPAPEAPIIKRVAGKKKPAKKSGSTE